MRYCTTCQSTKPEEGGYKKPNSTRGWMCKGCVDRSTPSIYKSKRKATSKDIERLMTAIYERVI
jgi:hypothetical protein